MNAKIANANEKPSPRRGIRLLWWFGIYFAAQLPLVFYEYGTLPFFYMFPQGLVSPYIAQIYPISPKNDGYTPWDLLYTNVLWIGYAVYVIHLALFLYLPGRHAFRVLLFVLTVVVLLNLGGCALTLHDAYGPPHSTH